MTTTTEQQTTPSGIPITYQQVSNYAFQGAMDKLRNAQFKDGGRCAYLVKKMSQAVDKVREVIRKEYRETILEPYAQRDAEGKYDEERFLPIEEKKEEFKKALEVFEAKLAYIDRPKFFAADIREAHLTAAEQEAIDPILDDSAFENMKAPGGAPQLRRA